MATARRSPASLAGDILPENKTEESIKFTQLLLHHSYYQIIILFDGRVDMSSSSLSLSFRLFSLYLCLSVSVVDESFSL